MQASKTVFAFVAIQLLFLGVLLSVQAEPRLSISSPSQARLGEADQSIGKRSVPRLRKWHQCHYELTDEGADTMCFRFELDRADLSLRFAPANCTDIVCPGDAPERSVVLALKLLVDGLNYPFSEGCYGHISMYGQQPYETDFKILGELLDTLVPMSIVPIPFRDNEILIHGIFRDQDRPCGLRLIFDECEDLDMYGIFVI